MSSVIAPVNKAVGAAAGATLALPTAPQIWGWIEAAIGNMPPLVDTIAVVLIGALITAVVTYFAPANVPAAK